MSLRSKYERAIDKYVNGIKDDPSIIGILITGSFVSDKLDENSDVDIHIIISEECIYRERGNTWIDGVEIEYFKNPPQQIRSYFKQEKNSPHTADMFANSLIKYKKSKVIDDLVKEATEIIRKRPKKLKNFEIELFKYHLDDIFKDLKDCLVNKEKANFKFVKDKLLNQSINIAYSYYRVRKTKEKKLIEQIITIDKRLAKLIIDSQDEKVFEIEKTKNLIRYIENLLGGKREKEWKLKSNLDL